MSYEKYDKITVTTKSKEIYCWEKEEWDDYNYDGKLLIVLNGGAWVGLFNMDDVESVVVK